MSDDKKPITMPPGVLRVLISREQIRDRVETMAREIVQAYREVPELVVLGVMNGSLIFLADLVRRLPIRVRYDMIRVSSYKKTQSTGSVQVESFPSAEWVRGKDVLLVDDIVDSGRTLNRICSLIQDSSPRSLRTAVILSKRVERAEPIDVDHIGFDIDDGFAIGYGLDYEGWFRDLPYIGLLDPSWEGA